MSLTTTALFIAEQWPVFACDAAKRPVTEHGFKDATRDPDQIARMFRRPGAEMIGVPTGPASDLLVIDLDVKDGRPGLEWLAANTHRLPRTRQHATRSGGRHLLFRYPTGREIRNSASRLAPGVDVRASGGYVIVPPSAGYTIHDDAMPAEVPAWLLAILDPPKPAPAPRVATTYRAPGDATPYGQSGIDRACQAIASAAHGQKHDTLNREAFNIGQLVAGGEITDSEAFARLQDALEAMHARQPCEDYRAAVRTLHAAYSQGKGNPRSAPPRAPIHVHVHVAPEPPPLPEPPEWWDAEPIADLGQFDEASAPQQPGKSPLWLDPGEWDERAIPKRPWLAPGYLLRGAVSALSGQGSGGKSSLVVAWTIALATGEELGEFRPTKPLIVVNYNVEDDQQEQRRRYSAALSLAGRAPADIANRVIRCGPATIGTLFERQADTGRIVPTAALDALERLLMETEADVLFCDPLAELHNCEENDNTAMRAVIAAFRGMAQRLGIAILILHHDRKGTSAPGDMDRMRGASAITGAVRVMLTLTPMSPEEADKFGVQPEHRRRHFRIDGAKSNYSLAQEAEWWKLQGVPLANGEEVAGCRPWSPPSAFGDLSLKDCITVLTQMTAGAGGIAYAARKQAGEDWAGRILTAPPYSRTDGQASAILGAWINSGVLAEADLPSPRRGHTRRAYEVNREALQEMRRQIEGAG